MRNAASTIRDQNSEEITIQYVSVRPESIKPESIETRKALRCNAPPIHFAVFEGGVKLRDDVPVNGSVGLNGIRKITGLQHGKRAERPTWVTDKFAGRKGLGTHADPQRCR